ncbi:MAG: enoyl-CoA hydratase/isomerase family protein [Candidatus Hydrogenedentes bacterium]|nr:enoyl-CoA hydratase/isomerase family protein [Candidatus Hydrogenedentota bacterium]
MAIHYEKDADNIVTLTMDLPGRSANVINAEFGQAFLDALNKVTQETELAGIILASAKDTFLAGGDLEMLVALDTPETAFTNSEGFKAQLRRLETQGKPVVAAINGAALGGGLELALACHHRIAIDNDKIKVGLPEVTLGLLPGGGGVTRMVRLLGLQAAFSYLMEGKQVSPKEALSAGIIHALAADRDDLIAKAKAWIKERKSAKQPWDESGYKMPGGDPRRPEVFQMLAIAPAMLRKRTYGNYPAPEAIMSAAVEGAQTDFDTASRIESRYFAQLATGQVAKNMISAFWFQLNSIKAGTSRPAGDQAGTKKVGVLGAGMMGHGIAYVSALSGMDVVMKDVTAESAQAGKDKIAKLLDKRLSRGKMTKEKRDEVLNRIVATADAADLKGCDLIIEAVFEDRALKAKVTVEAEAHLAENGVFASNTSTLPITGLAEPSANPENFVGLHFFSPVDKMPLVEIIKGAKTGEYALRKAFDYVLKIKKTPIVVNDSRGFYTSRVFGFYVNEGAALLAEGMHPRAIESAGLQAGMPVGPLALLDEVNLGLAMHIRDQTRKDFEAEGKTLPNHPGFAVVERMVTEFKRQGKAQGAGFYDYPVDGKKRLWPELQQHFPAAAEQLPQKEMIERMLFAQCLETVRCRDEGVFTSTADANIGSIFGWGFAPFSGGTLQYINAYGLKRFVTRAAVLASKYGERFQPPASLIAMAEKGETF